MLPESTPFVTVEGDAVAMQARQSIRVPVPVSRPLPFVPKPLTVLWTELINSQYTEMQEVTALVLC